MCTTCYLVDCTLYAWMFKKKTTKEMLRKFKKETLNIVDDVCLLISFAWLSMTVLLFADLGEKWSIRLTATIDYSEWLRFFLDYGYDKEVWFTDHRYENSYSILLSHSPLDPRTIGLKTWKMEKNWVVLINSHFPSIKKMNSSAL